MREKLNEDERAIIELVGLPGLSVILKYNRQEIDGAEQALLENKTLSLPDLRYYQGFRHGAKALRNYITSVIEKADMLQGDE